MQAILKAVGSLTTPVKKRWRRDQSNVPVCGSDVNAQQIFDGKNFKPGANGKAKAVATTDASAGAAVRSRKARFREGANEAVTYELDPT